LNALLLSGLDESETRFENISADRVLDALNSGKIDAGHTWEPTTSKALMQGYIILAKAGDYPGIITDVLAFKSKIVKDRPLAIKKIVKTMLEARDFIFSNRKEAIEIMAKALNMSKEEMDNGINGVHLLDLNENIECMKDTGNQVSLLTNARIISDFYISRGQMAQMPDYSKIIEPKILIELSKEKDK